MTGGSQDDRWGDLMRAGLAGDEAAYRALLGELARALRGTVRGALARTGRGGSDVEDIVQETLLAVHLKRGTWNTALPFAPWVLAVARYKVIDAIRRQGFRSHVSLDDLVVEIAAPSDDTSDTRDAERLILQLGERSQRIVRMISLEGRSVAEVAGVLGMNEVAVRVSLHRALKQLAVLYRKDGA